MMGTLVEVGVGKRPPGEILELLEARDRRRAGMTAPARGLFLVSVSYPPPWELDTMTAGGLMGITSCWRESRGRCKEIPYRS
jgi:tRNA U38,U39,U40 pseudouridine synthase TruA